MLIGIMSDSHDNFQGTIDALRLFRSKGAKMVLHAGDMVGSGNCYAFQGCGMDVKLVYGNNDGDRVVLARDFARVGGEYLGDFGVVEAGGLKIAILHGTDEAMVEALAACGKYDVLVRGHNHRAEISHGESSGEPLLINPGEIWGHFTGRRSVAVLDTSSRKADLIEMGSCKPFREMLSEWQKELTSKS